MMERLSQIKFIEGFRFFNDFKWEKGLKPFNRYNIIFGWNGCGKSTLCDFFESIETGKYMDCRFELRFQEPDQPERTINKNSISEVSNRFKVYHQNYVQGIVSNLDSIEHITIIGHTEAEKFDKVKKLEEEKSKLEANQAKLNLQESEIKKNYENFRRDKATRIRDLTGYPQSYNYNKILTRYNEIKDPVELSDEEFRRIKTAVTSKIKPKIDVINMSYLTSEECDKITSVLNESPVFKAIDKLQKDVELRKWVEEGYNLHKEHNVKVCEFCGNEISDGRWKDLECYFNDSLSDFRSHIKEEKELLDSLDKSYEKTAYNLPNETQFFDEYTEEYRKLSEQAVTLCDTYRSIIKSIIELLNKKDDEIVSNKYTEEFKELMTDIIVDDDGEVFNKINGLIGLHNEKVDSFDKKITEDKEKLEHHIIAESKSDFLEFENEIKECETNQTAIKKKIKEITDKINELDREMKNSRIPAEDIDSDIKLITGRSDLHFKWKENGYEILRGDKLAENLSTGEQNAIALIYFFNKLKDSSVSEKNTIVILDDPISSFDSNFYYSATAYIRAKLDSVGQAFILTHKFNLYKDLVRMFGETKDGKCNRYMLERISNHPVLKKSDNFLDNYQDEYVYLFDRVYKFVKQPPAELDDYIPYPNMGRRLLEGFVSFKAPNKETDVLKKVMLISNNEDSARVRAILRLVNNQSHIRRVGRNESDESILDIRQLPEIFKHLLEFIKAHDALHYNTIVEQIDSDGDILERDSDDAEATEYEKRTINLYDLKVSAGLGNILDDDISYEPYETTNDKADFAVKISGDSMVPYCYGGDIVLVKKQDSIENANIGIVCVDGEVYCKKIVTNGGQLRLVSLNREYKDIIVSENAEYKCFGIAIEVVKAQI